jgi:hypothetical protein
MYTAAVMPNRVTPYLTCLQGQFPPWKIKGLLGVKFEGPYLSVLEQIGAVLLRKDLAYTAC